MPPRLVGPSGSGLREPLSGPAGSADHLSLSGFRLGRPLPGMLLVARHRGLWRCCRPSMRPSPVSQQMACQAGNHPWKSCHGLLCTASRWQVSGSCVPTCPQLLGILGPGLAPRCESCSVGVLLHSAFEGLVDHPRAGRAVLLELLSSLLVQGCPLTVPPSPSPSHPSSASAFSRASLSC